MAASALDPPGPGDGRPSAAASEPSAALPEAPTPPAPAGVVGWGRVAVRAPVALGWTLGLFTLWNAGRPVAAIGGRSLGWRNGVYSTWGRGLLRILAVRLQVRGNPPEPPFLLVSNHLSYLDIPLLVGLMPCSLLSKAEVASWPLLGYLARAMGTLFVDRERKRALPEVAAAIRKELDRGQSVVFFPEGTSTSGESVLPFRTSLLASAARSGTPVHAAALGYRTPDGAPPADVSVCWWGDMEFGSHLLGLLALPRIDAAVGFDPDPVHHADRKELARDAEEKVQKLHMSLSAAPEESEPHADLR